MKLLRNESDAVRTGAEFDDAVKRIQADIDAVPDDGLETIHRDLDEVATTLLDSVCRIEPLLAQLESLPGFDIARMRKLGDYAFGLIYWNAIAASSAPATG